MYKKPDKQTLVNLYETQRMTSVEIAQMYGVSDHTALRWLHFYQIGVRPQGVGLATQGKLVPTQEELTKYIHEQFLSYEEIAQIFGISIQGIYYWMNKYDIQRPTHWASYYDGKLPQLPSKEEFLEMYDQGMSLALIAKQLDLTVDLLIGFCKKNAIQLRQNGFNGGYRFVCDDGHKVRSLYEQRIDNWLFEHHIEHIIEPPLPFDRRYRSDFFANGWYIEIWGIRRNASYLARKQAKQTQYKAHGLPLIEIYEYHFDGRRNEPWARKMQAVLIPPLS